MTTNKITRKQVSFRLREDLLMALREEARKANKSLNSFVESILADAMLKRTNEGNDVFIKNDTEV
jgi:predicted HicB family RNase H-like nuclease